MTLLPDLKDSAGVAWYGMVGLHGTHFFSLLALSFSSSGAIGGVSKRGFL